jgi:hypothetical protein
MIVAAVAATLETYLLMVQGQYRSVIRSQTWNTSLVVAESGVEEGLALINTYQGTATLISAWTNTATTNGWSNPINNSSIQVYTITRTLTNGSYTVYVTNVLSATNSIPAIVSSGTANWKLDTASAAQPIFASSGVAASSPSRTIFSQTSPDYLIGGGLLAITSMDFKGHTVLVDSYDSSDSTKSWFGPNGTNYIYKGNYYGVYTNTMRTADAVVGTLSANSGIINVGVASICGYVNTGPGGTANVNNNGSVGDVNWVITTSTHGIQPGHARDDMNTSFPNVGLPTPTNAIQNTWLPVPVPAGGSTNIGGTTYYYMITNNPAYANITNGVYYSIDSIAKSIFVNASNVVLYLTNGMSLGSHDVFVLTNGNIKIYTGGAISAGAQSTINNSIAYAPAFGIFGLSSCASMDFSGQGSGYLYVYAPQATVSFSGGGDVYGAYICHDITVNGNYNFHFDVVLKTLLPPSRYVPVTWKEQ